MVAFFQNQEEEFAKARKELNELREEESKLELQVLIYFLYFFLNPYYSEQGRIIKNNKF